MELDRINKLLEAYFEGNTSLAEEKTLSDYFNNENVAEHLVQYQAIFVGFKTAKLERSSKAFVLTESDLKTDNMRWYSVAAILVVALSVGSFYFSQPKYTQEEKEALAAFEKSKETMLLLSQNFNKGAERLTFLNQFEITRDKVFD